MKLLALLSLYLLVLCCTGRYLAQIEYSGIWHYHYRLDEHGGGNPQVYPRNGGDYQKWWIEDAGNGYVYIRSLRSGNVLDSNDNGKVYTHAHNGGWFQQWVIIDRIAYYLIRNRATNRFLCTYIFALDTLTLTTMN